VQYIFAEELCGLFWAT